MSNTYIGTKAKVCIVLLTLYPSFLTFFILESKTSIKLQITVLLMTILMAYLMAVLVQDYIYVKKHSDKSKCRHDLHLISSLLERHD